ncbi:MAG: class I SAM-dependent methyltransferase, partial [Thermoplasmata archaeon]
MRNTGPTRANRARDAWQRLYSKKGLHYGGTGDLSILKPHLKRDMLVLDAGCGDGKTAEALARLCEVVACDFSREALNALRAQRDPDKVVELVECNLYNTPFAPEKYSAVTCVHTLSHMVEKDRAAAAEQLSKVLVRGGYLYVEVFGRGDMRHGKGEEVEPSSFLRGDGIMTHYFAEGEVGALFPGMDVVTEVGSVRRVVFGVTAGKRDVLKVL